PLRVRALVAALVARHHEQDRRRRTHRLHALDDVRRPQLRQDRGDENETGTRAAIGLETLVAVLGDDQIEVLASEVSTDPVEIPGLVFDQQNLHRPREPGRLVASPQLLPEKTIIVRDEEVSTTRPFAPDVVPAARYAVFSLGCKVSRIDGVSLGERLREKG